MTEYIVGLIVIAYLLGWILGTIYGKYKGQDLPEVEE
jgi:hypothetical protein